MIFSYNYLVLIDLIVLILSIRVLRVNLPAMVLQISKAYLDKSIETEEIKYATPEKKKSQSHYYHKVMYYGGKN